jgi:hypothetical protein
MKKALKYIFTILFILVFANCSYAADQAHKTEVYKLKKCIETAINNSLDIELLKIQKKDKELDLDKANFYNHQLSYARDSVNSAQTSLNQLTELNRQLNAAGVPDSADISGYAGGQLPAGTTKAQLNTMIGSASAEIDKAYSQIDDSASNAKVEQLLRYKANTEIDVVNYAVEIAKEQISLLIQNSYYTIIKDKMLLHSKKAVKDRIKAQRIIAQNGYDAGMSPKDDVALCKLQEAAADIDIINAQRQLNIDKIGIKKNMNIDLSKDIDYKDSIEADLKNNYDLQRGIESGLQKRIEMKKANAELLVSKLNFEITKRYDQPNMFDYQEAENTYLEAQIKYKQQKLEIEAGIRQSYENLINTQKMLADVTELSKSAKENFKAVKDRYDVGIDLPSPNLRDSNLQDLSGTIVDVLAAQEKLSQVEEKRIELIFNYNQAKAKYLYDIGERF